MDGQINRNERYKSTRYFFKCKFINVYINSFSIKNNYFKLLNAKIRMHEAEVAKV